jgi:hypothetical protein
VIYRNVMALLEPSLRAAPGRARSAIEGAVANAGGSGEQRGNRLGGPSGKSGGGGNRGAHHSVVGAIGNTSRSRPARVMIRANPLPLTRRDEQ